MVRNLPAVAVAILLGAVLTTSVARAADPLPTMTVTEDFAEMGVNWNDGYGKGYIGRMQVFGQNGVLVLCGAGAYLDASNRMGTRTILKRAKFKMNGQTILKDFTYFTQVDRAENVMGSQATCRSTGVAEPKSEVTFDVDYGKRAVRF